MIDKTFRDEFRSEGAEVVREKIAKRAYTDDKRPSSGSIDKTPHATPTGW
jgi:hypothetical protein